jgi:hypothetical protein
MGNYYAGVKYTPDEYESKPGKKRPFAGNASDWYRSGNDINTRQHLSCLQPVPRRFATGAVILPLNSRYVINYK